MSLYSELQRRNVIRVAAAYIAISWLLIQVIGEIFPLFGGSDATARYVVIALTVGFVPALIIAWAFEWTPQGFRRDTEVDPAVSIAPQTGRKIDRIIIVVLVIAVTYFAADKFWPTETESPSIAVLLFDDLSPDGDQAWFATGISEEMMNLLARVKELRVIGRTTVEEIDKRGMSVTEIGEQFDVTHVLEGSVRSFENNLRITAQIIDAKTDTHIWSQTYDREMGDIFEIQDEISAIVVDELKVKVLGTMPVARRTDTEAHLLYLRAINNELSGLDSAIYSERLMKQALDIDPEYAPALTRLAGYTWFLTGESRYRKYAPAEGRKMTREYIDRALAADPYYAEAIALLGFNVFELDRDPFTAASYFDQALKLEPANPEVNRLAGGFARYVGLFEQSAALAGFALERDPLCGLCMLNLSRASYYMRNFEQAEAAILMMQEQSPGGHISYGNILLLKGEAQAALEEYDKHTAPEEGRLAGRALALYELQRFDEFEQTLSRLVDKFADEAPEEIARVYAWIGDKDTAFEWLDRVYGEDIGRFFLIAFELTYQNLFDDPRWLELRRRAGNDSATAAKVDFNPTLPDVSRVISQ